MGFANLSDAQIPMGVDVKWGSEAFFCMTGVQSPMEVDFKWRLKAFILNDPSDYGRGFKLLGLQLDQRFY